MADTKLPDLPGEGGLVGGDLVYAVRAGADVKATVPTDGYATNDALALKADASALAAKANTTDVTDALALKADASALAAKADLVGAQTFSGGQRSSSTAVSSASASTALDFALNNDFTTTLTENTTLANPTNLVVGQKGRITITQAAAAKTVAYGSYFKFAGGTIPSVSTGSGAIDILFYDVIAGDKIAATLVKAFA